MAALAETSTATVVRCAQKLGLRGFHALKLALAQELAVFERHTADTPAVDARAAALHDVTRAGAQTVSRSCCRPRGTVAIHRPIVRRGGAPLGCAPPPFMCECSFMAPAKTGQTRES